TGRRTVRAWCDPDGAPGRAAVVGGGDDAVEGHAGWIDGERRTVAGNGRSVLRPGVGQVRDGTAVERERHDADLRSLRTGKGSWVPDWRGSVREDTTPLHCWGFRRDRAV